jgi:murein DD-endopeptidase MepM/ murein hydrolase activator NlpD
LSINSRSKYNSLRAGIQLNIPPETAHSTKSPKTSPSRHAQQYASIRMTSLILNITTVRPDPETVLVKHGWCAGRRRRARDHIGGRAERVWFYLSGSISGTYILWVVVHHYRRIAALHAPIAGLHLDARVSLGGHEGVDLAADVGSRFRRRRGTVAWRGRWILAGYAVVTGTADLQPVRALARQQCGQSVSAGQGIGRSGNSGNSTGPHLHFELRDANWNPINPQNYIGF